MFGDFVGGVVLVEREGVGGVEAAEGGEVVEWFEGAGDRGFVAVGVEVACVAGVVEGWGGGRRCELCQRRLCLLLRRCRRERCWLRDRVRGR